MVKSRAQASQRVTSDKVNASCSLTLSFRRRKNSFKMRKMSESESDVGSPSGSLFLYYEALTQNWKRAARVTLVAL